MDIPITQSKEWQHLQDDLGETSFFEKTTDYQFLAILKKTPVGNYLYLPYGPAYKDKKSFKDSLRALTKIAKEHQAIFIRIEPRDPDFTSYAPKNIKKTKDLNPKETWLLDLTGNEDDLKNRLPSRLLRYYRNAAKNGLKIEASNDPSYIDHLLKFQRALAGQKGINTFSSDYLKTELKQPFATAYLAKYQNPENDHEEVVAAGLVFDDSKVRYNLQGAQSEQGKKLHATGILTIQLILDAKAKNLKIFDFWGIAPEGAPDSHPWAGFTNFKKTFAGYEKDYAGTYDIILSPARYKLYLISRSINRLFRRGHKK